MPAAPDSVSRFVSSIEKDGFYLWDRLLTNEAIEMLLHDLKQAEHTAHARKKDGKTYALRNILNVVPSIKETSVRGKLFDLICAVLGNTAQPVKATLFDKTAEANWNLRWHQDNVIAVAARKEVPGFHGWSEKIGVMHVRPPAEILEQMLAARIHLDDCPVENGPLMVIAASHSNGRLDQEDLARLIEAGHTVLPAKAGDVLFMRPLLVHSSKPAAKPEHRRILHIEFAACELPGGLAWAGE